MINDSKMQNDNKTGSSVQFHGPQCQPKAQQLLLYFFSAPFIIFTNKRFNANKEIGLP